MSAEAFLSKINVNNPALSMVETFVSLLIHWVFDAIDAEVVLPSLKVP
jgi:hypothetical protein